MNFYIGVTDTDWFEYLAGINPDEVNFWNLESRDFRAINIGELFLFKNKYPDNAPAISIKTVENGILVPQKPHLPLNKNQLIIGILCHNFKV